MTIKRTFGWHPDLSDLRDFKYSAALTSTPLPELVDLRKKCSPVEEQGSLGSCTAHAGVGLLEYLDRKDDNRFLNLSRLFLYYNTRVLEGTVNSDSGASIRNTMKAMTKYGVCAEWRWAYIMKNFKLKPSALRYGEGLKHSIKGYYRLTTLTEIKTSISNNMPVLFGFSIYESFMSDEVERTGVAPMPKSDESMLGGHACLIVGYDDSKQVFIVRNSWGKDFGDNGYFYMPYAYVTQGIANDFWTAR